VRERAQSKAGAHEKAAMERFEMWDSLWIEANLATMRAGAYGAIRSGALGVKDGRIVWVGARADLPGAPDTLAREVIACGDCWITPGFVDCHTHLVFAGNRAHEFEMRLEGATYEEISRAGGGIASTVKATRAASEQQLMAAATPRVRALIEAGVTTVEIKSGYGLDLETELKMLRVARALEESFDIRVRTSFLGLHALPSEHKADRAAYVALVCDEMIPAVAVEGLADAVDAFCETIGFTREETERVFKAARAHGLDVKLHAEQLSDQGGAELAARFHALSADHLEHVSDAGISAMARAGTVAVLLPGAFYCLRETQAPPIEKLRAACVPMAIATDCNPGTSPVASPLMAMNMACTLFRLTPEEALAGVTCHGARALGLGGEIGTLEIGKAADFALWRIDEPAELAYWIGADLLQERVRGGRAALA
jgi:imidazolonepropionase